MEREVSFYRMQRRLTLAKQIQRFVQEILFVRELITAAGINGQDVQTAVQLLMPEKSSEYISKLSIMLCSNRDKENISERKSPQ